jgi:hypothetical protein
MGFPELIAGRLTLPCNDLPSSVDAVTRLYGGLVSQTVDELERKGTKLHFCQRRGIHAPIPRPDGSHWLFDGVDYGAFTVTKSPGDVEIEYELGMRTGFRVILALAVAVSASIYLFGKPST